MFRILIAILIHHCHKPINRIVLYIFFCFPPSFYLLLPISLSITSSVFRNVDFYSARTKFSPITLKSFSLLHVRVI
jgi:hypothetical protein